MSLLFNKPWTRQPQGPVGIDRSNPLARGLIACLSPFSDHIKNGPTGTTGTIIRSPTIGGIATAASANSGNHCVFGGSANVGSGNLTDFCLIRGDAAAGGTVYLFGCGTYDGTTGTGIAVESSSIGNRWGASDSDLGMADAGEALPADGKLHLLVHTRDGTNHRLYRNGSLKTTTEGSSAASSNAVFVQNSLQNAGTFSTTRRILLSGRFNRALSDSEVAQLAANPWQIFQPQTRRLYVESAAGGVQNLAATATAQATATADLSKGVFLAAAALSVASGTAGMSLSVPLAASATGQASSSGQISLTVTFAANAVATALATADLTLAKPLAASAAGQATGTAALDVVAAGGTVNLAATAQAQATGSAALSLAINLSAAAVAQATATAALGGSAALAAAAIANAQATAALAVGKPLSGAAQAQASAGATLWLDVPLSAAALAQAAAGGALSLTVNLAAAAVSTATAGASLPSEVLLSASGAAVATSTATLMVMGGMDSSINRPFVIRQTHRSWSKKQTSRY